MGYVRHHTIYDHLNISDYTIELSQSDHTKLHFQMKHDGIEISHINVRVNDIHGFKTFKLLNLNLYKLSKSITNYNR